MSRAAFSPALQSRPASLRPGTSLRVNRPTDPAIRQRDRQDDHAADTTSGSHRLPGWSLSSAGFDRIQRPVSVSHPAQPTLASTGSPAVDSVVRSPGRPLDPRTRRDMESGFGFDLSHVRLHTDTPAAATAHSLAANAYTVGSNIVFAPGRFAPDSTEGRFRLAHELTHVLQQSSAAPTPLVQRQPAPAPKETPATLAADLHKLIDQSSWPEIRKRVYPKESKLGIDRARNRHDAKAKDLTGVGSLASLDSFATAMHGVQKTWNADPKANPDARVASIGKAADDALVSASVPKFKKAEKEDMSPRGRFLGGPWELHVKEAMVNDPTLSDPAAADLTNTVLHETRHAEQAYVAARYAAGFEKADAAKLAAEGLNSDIASAAVANKMDATTHADVKNLGKAMRGSDFGVEGTNNAAKEQAMEDELPKLNAALANATAAVTALDATPQEKQVAAARQQRKLLLQEVAKVEQRYGAYRAIPHEADAHEVGDAAELAFGGWK